MIASVYPAGSIASISTAIQAEAGIAVSGQSLRVRLRQSLPQCQAGWASISGTDSLRLCVSRSRNDRIENQFKGFVRNLNGNSCFRLNPAAVQRVFDRRQLHGIGDIRVGGHVEKLSGQPIRSHFEP